MLVMAMFFYFVSPSPALGFGGASGDWMYINSWDDLRQQPNRHFEPKWEMPTIALRSLVVNRFVLSNGYVDYSKPLIQSDLHIGFKNGFYVNLWNSKPLEKESVESTEDEGGLDQGESVVVTGNELDYTVGWSGPIVFGAVVDIGSSYCDLPRFGKMGAVEDVLYSYVKISKTAGAVLDVTVTAEKFTVMHLSPYRGGALYAVGLSKSDSYLREKLTLDISLEGVHDTGNFGNQQGKLIRGKVGFGWNLFKNLTIILPKLDSYLPIGRIHDDRKMETAITGGLIYWFK
jgi:hypothetical protein